MVLPGQFLGVSVSSVNFASMTRTPNLNTLTLSNFPSSPTTIASNNVITFVLSSITNPLSTQPLALNISFYRNSQIYQTSSASYTATSGTLSAFTIAPDSNFVHITGAATITLDSALTFPAGSILTLTFPSSVSATDSVAALVTSCSLNGTVKTGVTFEISSNQIIFRNIFVSSFKGTVVLKISSFTNPPTTQPSTYSLAAYDSSSYVVLTSSYVLTAATKALASNSVTANSLTVLATGVTITVSLTTNYPFTAVSIQVPA
jgi:CO dehydrogenase/acetyl-CoA synthase gamma subunit (corrinoid Fe-S protein)